MFPLFLPQGPEPGELPIRCRSRRCLGQPKSRSVRGLVAPWAWGSSGGVSGVPSVTQRTYPPRCCTLTCSALGILQSFTSLPPRATPSSSGERPPAPAAFLLASSLPAAGEPLFHHRIRRRCSNDGPRAVSDLRQSVSLSVCSSLLPSVAPSRLRPACFDTAPRARKQRVAHPERRLSARVLVVRQYKNAIRPLAVQAHPLPADSTPI